MARATRLAPSAWSERDKPGAKAKGRDSPSGWRYSIPSMMNARNRSAKSGFIGQVAAQPQLFQREPPHQTDTLYVRNLHPELEIVAVRLSR